jgi:mycothiol system anti-sigma-R factor
MSCGDPHETPCSEVLDAVYLYLDGEQDDEHREVVRLHLDECAPCLRQYGLEQAVKALVARCCGGDSAPVELRERVLVRIQEVRLEIDHVEYRAE